MIHLFPNSCIEAFLVLTHYIKNIPNEKLNHDPVGAWTFASCGKETYKMNSPVSGERQVTGSFTNEPNATRPLFDPISKTEAREKSLPSISLFRFDTDGPDRKA